MDWAVCVPAHIGTDTQGQSNADGGVPQQNSRFRCHTPK